MTVGSRRSCCLDPLPLGGNTVGMGFHGNADAMLRLMTLVDGATRLKQVDKSAQNDESTNSHIMHNYKESCSNSLELAWWRELTIRTIAAKRFFSAQR